MKLSKKGFSLIELMIVVAIIGILSALAIPNFLKYQAKAKQAEAKLNLAALYTSEKAFFAEYTDYTSYTGTLGFKPDGAKSIYGIGFSADYPSGTGDWSTSKNISVLVGPRFVDGTTGTLANSSLCSDAEMGTAVATNNSFTAAACGSIGTSGIKDLWTINDNKALSNTRSGL